MSIDVEGDSFSASAVQHPFGSRHTYHHTTLKQSVPKRWNATLIMMESIPDNETQVNWALLQTGNRELTISSIEKALLQDLWAILEHVETFTQLVSGNLPHLGLITIIRFEIQQVCKSNERDSAVMKVLKRLVTAKMNSRLPETEMSRLATLLDPSMNSTRTELCQNEKVTILKMACKSLPVSLPAAGNSATAATTTSIIMRPGSSKELVTEAGFQSATMAPPSDLSSKSVKCRLVEKMFESRGVSQNQGLEDEILKCFSLDLGEH